MATGRDGTKKKRVALGKVAIARSRDVRVIKLFIAKCIPLIRLRNS